MSRMPDDKKEHFARDSTMTSSSAIRSMQNLSQALDKDKNEKTAFVQHNFTTDSSFRTHELLKPTSKQPPGRNIASASIGANQLHSMPPLLPNYITGAGHMVNPVPINHTPMMRSNLSTAQHGFPTHIQTHIGIGAVSAIAPPRGSVSISQRASLPTLKPTNLPNQIQLPLNQIPSLPTILPPSAQSRTGSPSVSSHDRGATILSDHGVRGNLQAAGAQATIQVIASGTAVQQGHLPANFLSKGVNLTSSNMLKINVSNHGHSSTPNTGIPVSAFKLGLGKPGSSGLIIPATTAVTRTDISHDIRHIGGSGPYNRFPVNHILSTTPHTTTSATTSSHAQSSVTISNVESRAHSASASYHPINAAYVFRDMGLNFTPQLIRPPTTSVNALPTFMPIVSIAVSPSKGNIQVSKSSNEEARSEGLTIQGNTSFNIQNLYPNLQTSTATTAALPSSASSLESSVRPSILRKRPADTGHTFPVQPTEKERVMSPMKTDSVNVSIATRIYSPASMSSERTEHVKPINHSIVSITADVKTSLPNNTATEMSVSAETTITMSVSKTTVPTTVFKNQFLNTVPNHNLMDASPKKKPRKQSIITTEDKYGSTTNHINSNFNSTSDADEEFLKSNETMKDITPPKLTAATSQITTTKLSATSRANTSFQKPLFDGIPQLKTKLKQETKEVHLNGMLAPLTSPSTAMLKTNEPAKIFVFRRKRPKYGILNDCKVNTKAAHNHFYRHSDIRLKEEKKPTASDFFSSKTAVQSASGWRLHHLSNQLDDMVSLEKEIRERLLSMKGDLPETNYDDLSLTRHPVDTRLTPEETQLFWVKELLLGNIQRCSCFLEQLDEVKSTMLKVLEHKPKVFDIIKSHKLKPRVNKKKPHT